MSLIRRHFRTLWTAIFAGLLLVACGEIIADPATVTPEFSFQQYSNDAAFEMLYPSTWQFDLIQEGLLAFAHPDSLNLDSEELQANMVVFRQAADPRFTSEDDLTHYLDNGPLKAGFELVEDAPQLLLDAADSASAMVVRNSAENPATSFVISARTESGALYTITATAPQHGWDFWWPHFQVMFASIQFNE